MLTHEYIKSVYKKYGYPFLEKPFQVNPFGIRSKDLSTVNLYNDIIGFAFKDAFGVGQCLAFRGTTKPGLYWLKNKLGNVNGTFILAPGFYEDCWQLSQHHYGKPNAYDAYVQSKAGVFLGWRDNDSDGQFDMAGKPTFTDVSGLNQHHGADKDLVGAYSAACQVIEQDKEHFIGVAVGKRHIELYTNSLNYALFQAQ
jgi:hypothetical protein